MVRNIRRDVNSRTVGILLNENPHIYSYIYTLGNTRIYTRKQLHALMIDLNVIKMPLLPYEVDEMKTIFFW